MEHRVVTNPVAVNDANLEKQVDAMDDGTMPPRRPRQPHELQPRQPDAGDVVAVAAKRRHAAAVSWNLRHRRQLEDSAMRIATDSAVASRIGGDELEDAVAAGEDDAEGDVDGIRRRRRRRPADPHLRRHLEGLHRR